MNEKYLTVSVVNKYLKHKLDSDPYLQNIFIKGEISNCKVHGTGHIYFSIKDETSKINAIMFSGNAQKLKFTPIDGNKVLISGRISVYEATGNYQIYVDTMEEDGLGNLHLAFEKLKQQLSSEGLFDEKHKQPIPKFPSKIGVITANTGAAIKDIISTIKRRYPIAEIILFPCLVQGDNAKDDIVKNINLADNYHLDVLIIGRGGGSIEDLWPFNEEIVARAIFASKIPIISAVGHEIDYTIADFVADLRAPTPTAAAEMAVPNITELAKIFDNFNIRLKESILKNLNFKKLYLDSLKNSYVIKNPQIIYENQKQKLDLINLNLNKIIVTKLENYKKDLSHLINKLDLLSPLNTLKRGYSLVYKDNKIIKTIKKLKINEILTIKLSDGDLNVMIKEINNEI